jgi:hypothetical protein
VSTLSVNRVIAACSSWMMVPLAVATSVASLGSV